MGLEGDVLGVVLGTDGIGATCQIQLSSLTTYRHAASGRERAASSVGGLVKIAVEDMLLVGSVTELNLDGTSPELGLTRVEYIGEGARGADGNLSSFKRGVSSYPLPGDMVRLATPSDERQIFSPGDIPHVKIGTVHPTETVRAPVFFDQLMSRHFAVVGSSGTGKSTTVTLLLQRIIEAAPNSHVVVLDPHGEYASAFGDKAQVWNVNNLQLPYWLMSLEEHCEAFISDGGDARRIETNILAKCLLKARLQNTGVTNAAKVTADTPISYQVNDLINALQDEVGKLQKPAEAHHYTVLQLSIEQLFNDPRYSFTFNRALWDRSAAELLGEILRIPGHGKPISIVDLAGVPSEVVRVVVATLSRLIFDYGVWAPRNEKVPVLIVCEEAHRYLPSVRSSRPGSAERQLEQIAREGRKYGICLALVTQRPSELSDTALSQCGTIIAMRLNNTQDQAQLAATMTEGGRAYLDIIPALQNQECIISGVGVPVPMHVRIDTLASDARPSSDDPVFSEKWNKSITADDILHNTVRRWVGSG